MYYNEKTMVFLDGNWIKANDAKTNLYSQTLHYGNGVFEGIRSYETPKETSVFKAKEHYERLLYSAKKMHIQLNYSVEELITITYTLLEKNNLTNAYIRPLAFLGENMGLAPANKVHFFMAAWQWEKYLGNKLLDVMISSYQRPNSKSCHVEAKVVGHYTNSILATTEAKANGFDEALLLDANGFVAEAPGSNFFMEKEKKIFTPKLGNILTGITRATVIELCYESGLTIEEKNIIPEEVEEADGAFFTGTAAEISGIKSIGKKQLKMKWEDTLGFILSQKYNKKVIGQ